MKFESWELNGKTKGISALNNVQKTGERQLSRHYRK
jgi:hypothetical protein